MPLVKLPLCTLFAAALLSLGLSAHAEPQRNTHVIVVSIDGLPAEYWDTPGVDMPNLRRLAATGARAEGMTSVPPTVTWPNHTTMVTGVGPARHGVVANTYFDRTKQEPVNLIWDPLFDQAEIVKVPTVYDLAHRAGLRTAGIAWPATRNAPHLDWKIPCVTTAELLERYSTPELLSYLATLGITPPKKPEWDKADATAKQLWDWMHLQAAKYVLREKRPHLLFLYVEIVDAIHHRYGRNTPEGYWAAHAADQIVGEMVDTVRNAGLLDRTTFVIVSDHGFRNYTKQINFNAVLRNAGLITTAGNRIVSARVRFVSMGGGAGIYILDQAHREELLAEVTRLATACEGIEAIAPTDAAALAAEPRLPDLMLSAVDGYAFSGRVPTLDPITPIAGTKGAHGHLPNARALEGVFVASGAAIKPGVRLPTIRNVDVAPTLAAVLGLEMPEIEGRVLTEILR